MSVTRFGFTRSLMGNIANAVDGLGAALSSEEPGGGRTNPGRCRNGFGIWGRSIAIIVQIFESVQIRLGGDRPVLPEGHHGSAQDKHYSQGLNGLARVNVEVVDEAPLSLH
jgi:hypothetical protein